MLEEKVEAIIRRNDRPEIHLYFKGNTMPRKNNWYKDFNDRLELCKSLVGKKIATDVYGKWDKNAWFKNIYVLNEDDDIPF